MENTGDDTQHDHNAKHCMYSPSSFTRFCLFSLCALVLVLVTFFFTRPI